jgi:hypothetical protein
MGRRKDVGFSPDAVLEHQVAQAHAEVVARREQEAEWLRQRNNLFAAMWLRGYTQADIAGVCNSGLPDASPHMIGEDAVGKAFTRGRTD